MDQPEVTLPEDAAEQQAAEDVAKQIKRGFSLKDRLEKRGLRRVSVTLFLDENVGAEHKAVADRVAAIDAQIAELNESIDGQPEAALVRVIATAERDGLVAEREPLVQERDKLEAKLKADSITVAMRAVPPVIAKDARRRAKVTCDITEKTIPEDKAEEFVRAYNAHMLSLVVQTITDSASGETVEGLDYEGAIDMANYLPQGQYVRLSQALNEVQFRDAFSQTIEGQEDFS